MCSTSEAKGSAESERLNALLVKAMREKLSDDEKRELQFLLAGGKVQQWRRA